MRPDPHAVSRRSLLAAGTGLLVAACSSRASTPAATPAAPRGLPQSAVTGTPSSRPTVAATTPAPTPLGPATEVVHGPRTRPEVALTFHGAGDPALATAILRVLAGAKAQVTVLAVGTWLAANPTFARRITDAGHELGNHTWTHPVLDGLPAAQAKVEIDRCRDLLVSLTGSPGGHFRQSSAVHATPLVRTLAGRAGYPVCLSYDLDSLDWTDPGPEAVRRTVAAGVQPGSVVSMHFGHPGTLAALPGVLADLSARGLRPVTATTLLRA